MMNEQQVLEEIEKRAAEIRAFREKFVTEEFVALFPQWEEQFKALAPEQIRGLIMIALEYGFNNGLAFSAENGSPKILEQAKKFLDSNPILTMSAEKKNAH